MTMTKVSNKCKPHLIDNAMALCEAVMQRQLLLQLLDVLLILPDDCCGLFPHVHDEVVCHTAHALRKPVQQAQISSYDSESQVCTCHG